MTVPRTSAEIRKAFLDFFEENRHTIVPSAPLPNRENPTLLFTNAGMNQFTNVFLGKEKRDYTRATSSQKCMRIQGKQNDLENVGPSPRHHTMFEMLGNFSFGDYFKEQAIDYAWLFLTEVLKLDKQRLWVTIYTDDDEAEQYWRKHTAPERILRFGKKDNFWEMGETGPCGPCSEIHYYLGPLAEQTAAGVNVDDAYLELWNLVFMQFERDDAGELHPLPRPSIDTGMGLERMAQVMQGVASNYDTDVFLPVMDRLQERLGHTDAQRAEQYVAYRVIADHGRAATFLIGDGVLPGNVGEGYVIRMIIRRAARFGRKLGFTEPFLAHVAAVLAQTMGEVYPELRLRLDHIQHALTQEEERFNRTLDSALARLDNLLAALAQQGMTEIDGETAFTLYATYGLPLEITRDVAQEHGFTVDEAAFDDARAAHAAASGAGAFGQYTMGADVYGDVLVRLVQSGRVPASGVDYDPYSGAEMESEILALLVDGRPVSVAQTGAKLEIVTAATPFYVESGGEVSDTGTILIPETGAEIHIHDTRRPVPGLIVHVGEVARGPVQEGQAVLLAVDDVRRADIRRNHTATHILHRELRAHLGTHVTQAGSLVAPDRLRFDFTHTRAMSAEEKASIERAINAAILQDMPVNIQHMKQKEAISAGAMALFGEKYGDIVRTIQITEADDGHNPYSFELCGGLHVGRTGEIGLFHFTNEEAVAAGVRRVEAVTGEGAQSFVAERLGILRQLAETLNAPIAEAMPRLEALQRDFRALQKEHEALRRRLLLARFDDLAAQARDVRGVAVLAAAVDDADQDGLRELADRLRDGRKADVVVLATVRDERPVFVAMVRKEMLGRGLHAGNLVRDVAKIVGGGGGGRPDMAQAGGKDAAKLPAALAAVPDLVARSLK
ncbi:MAG: alanine--tRNA ligase [Anaerolineales bacterium]|nr:alanine--tRNA ligase [Anaerolineales bacterium]MCB8952068.1 alanine--tRNA ligase [Ardenticatenales bacterium]